MVLKNITDKGQYLEALTGIGLTIIFCSSTWSSHCQAIKPQVIQFSREYPDSDFYEMDIDEVPDVAADLGVRDPPTFYLFKSEENVGEIVGANPRALKAAIEQNR